MPAFTPRVMKGYFDVMLEVAEQLAGRWEAEQGADIPVADHMTRLTLDTISLAGFGYRFNSFDGGALHAFLTAMVNVLSETMVKMTRLPVVNRIAGDSATFQRDLDTMNALVDEVIRQRRAQPVDSPDLLNLMLEAVDPQTGRRLDETNIRHQVITFLVAGHETTSGLLTFALYMLLRNPHTLARAYAEVDRVLPGDTRPEFRHLAQLEVIERVLKETLRLWPTAPAFNVAPYEDTIIGGRYPIPKDQVVSVAIPALHRDPAVWAEPEVFDIERFTPENERALHPHGYKPFGNGQRACIGRQFALTEAKLALAVILQRFAISDPYDYRLQIKETLTLKPEGFRIRIRRRDPSQGLVAAAVADTPQPSPTQRHEVAGAGRPVLVLYGSSLGTSRDVAEALAAEAAANGFDVVTATLDERIESLPESGILLVVTATYNGHAPDTAKKTERLLDEQALARLQRPNLSYAVLGCGDSQWPDFQAFPARVEAALADSGATALVERGVADASADFDGAVEAWVGALWAALDSGERPAAPAVSVTHVSPERLREGLLPADTRRMEVLANEELVQDPTGLWDFALEPPRPSTRRLRLRLPEGMAYRTGDHLGLYPGNRPELVQAVARRLGLAPDDAVVLTGESGRARQLPLDQPVTVARLLADFVELQQPLGRQKLRRLAEDCGCPHTRAELQRLLADDEDGFRPQVAERHLSVFDLLQQYPALNTGLDLFLDLCGPLRPRYYSISSAAEAEPGVLELTVGTVQGPAWFGRGVYRGVASAFVEALRRGDRVLGVVRRPDPPFAPPESAAEPMILIGPGTGIAPFRGFIQARAVRRAAGEALGRTLLFQGSRHPRHDWLYAEELQGWAEAGIVALHTAFSCEPEHPYRYVQDALWAAREQVWALLQAGARIYVCGDGRHMAPAVRQCLMDIRAEREGGGAEGASAWLDSLMAAGRYRQDLFTT